MKKWLLVLIVRLLTGPIAIAATYYMPDDCANLHECFGVMQGGDTLIIRDGVYTGEENTIGPYPNMVPENGEDDNYTSIVAEHNGRVVINGEGEREPLNINGYHSYIKVKGIVFKNTNAREAGAIRYADHIKLLNCAFVTEGKKDSHSADSLMVRDSSYILIENCYSWGDSFYHFIFYHVDHSIARRCIVRHDTGNWVYQAGFTNYQSGDMRYQNCIVIDVDQEQYYTNVINGESGGHNVWAFLFANSGDYSDIEFNGCIALNGYFQVAHMGDNYDAIFNNIVGWDTKQDRIINNHGGGWLLTHCTLGVSPNYGVVSYVAKHMDVNNSIIYGCDNVAVSNSYGGIEDDYNVLYANRYNFERTSSGDHDLCEENSNAIDPIDGSPGNGIPALKYLPRIEDGSDLDGAASDGGDIGATVLYKIGRSGTLWGEEGYNETTDEPLWPFPNEDLIKEKMSAYTYDQDGDGNPEITGKRGFCADGAGLYGGRITLTSYIWEYLGNPCPVDVCNYYDVNRDGHVNVQDTQIVANHILGIATSENADTTGDGSVTIQDVQGVVNVILAGTQG